MAHGRILNMAEGREYMRIAWVAFAGIAACATVQGQPGRGRGLAALNIGFSTLDSDNDGVLSATEIAAAPTSLAKLDKNSDGQITSDEIGVAMPQGRGSGGPDGPEGAGADVAKAGQTRKPSRPAMAWRKRSGL